MRRVALPFLAFLTLATACAGERPTLDDAAQREVDPVDTAATGVAPVALRLAVPGNWSGDPADAGPASISSRVLADLLFEGLTRLDDGGVAQRGLAERWFVSDDRLTWTFVLPDDLTDGGGEVLGARDVKRSLERVAARGTADHAASALTSVIGWSDRMAGTTGGVAGISAPDNTTVVIRLSTPFEMLLDVLASPAYGITGEASDGTLRTTGAYRNSDATDVLVAVDDDNPVASVELVIDPGGPVAAMAAGDADWAVLAPGDDANGLQADILRQPLELEVALVARMPTSDERLGLLGALQPLLLANSLEGFTGRSVGDTADPGVLPAAAFVDVPEGALEPLGEAVVAQLEDAGVGVLTVTSTHEDFARRLADGDALVFPILIAGGMGPAGGVLRLATPGAIDDVFGPESEDRAQLSAAVMAEIDVEQRDLFAVALERALIADGYLLPVGRFEVRVAMGTRLDGLRHRMDGTLDLSEAVVAGDQ